LSHETERDSTNIGIFKAKEEEERMAEDSSKLVQSLRSLELDLPPSCVEFCPAFPPYFLVGTYSLQPEGSNSDSADANAVAENEDGQATQPRQPQSRNGSIVAFTLLDGVM
jgi:diphthamide biosynthesis protein 7